MANITDVSVANELGNSFGPSGAQNGTADDPLKPSELTCSTFSDEQQAALLAASKGTPHSRRFHITYKDQGQTRTCGPMQVTSIGGTSTFLRLPDA